MGITISPLRLDCWQSRGREPADAPESIVTIVARVNLGGAFSSPWLSWLLPRTSVSWLGSLLGSIVQVRPLTLCYICARLVRAMTCGCTAYEFGEGGHRWRCCSSTRSAYRQLVTSTILKLCQHHHCMQTRDNVEQLRFVAPPVSLLARREPVTPAAAASRRMAEADSGPAASPTNSRVTLVRGHSTRVSRYSAASAVAGAASADHTSTHAAPQGDAAAGAGDDLEKPTTWLAQHYYSSPAGNTCASPHRSHAPRSCSSMYSA